MGFWVRLRCFLSRCDTIPIPLIQAEVEELRHRDMRLIQNEICVRCHKEHRYMDKALARHDQTRLNTAQALSVYKARRSPHKEKGTLSLVSGGELSTPSERYDVDLTLIPPQ